MTGTIFDIQRQCVHDGPGVRTTVFFKGCNLRCMWCHNPESISPKNEMQYFADSCIGCGYCAESCNEGCHSIQGDIHLYDRSSCKACGRCTENCLGNALISKGEKKTAEELLEPVLIDKIFYVNGGGVTCSGGEPMLQADFLRVFLDEVKQHGIHTAIDTAGNVHFSEYAKVLDVCDLFLYDLKTNDSDSHRKFTGADNKLIKCNLEKLCHAGKPIWVRVPIIPSVNDKVGQLQELINSIPTSSSIKRVEFLRFHNMADNKYQSLGRERRFDQNGYTDKDFREIIGQLALNSELAFYADSIKIKHKL